MNLIGHMEIGLAAILMVSVMTTAKLLKAFARECPNGVSFNPMALRLLRKKIPFEDWQIRKLKTMMFQLGNGLWFSREMILDDESRPAFEEQAIEWIAEYGCFSVERLFEQYRDVLRHIDTPGDCAAFLKHLDFMIAGNGRSGYFCFLPTSNLDANLATISETIAEWIEEADGTLAFNEIEQALPHLTIEALESIRAQLLSEIYITEIGGVPCWCNTEAVPLPEDFSEKLTNAVDTLVTLGEKVTIAKLEFALNLFYRIRLREEYALLDNDTFIRICAQHYQGGNNVFLINKKNRARTNDGSVPGRRVRSPNTRFHNLGVPVGAQLTFTKNSHITCTVLDDSNQVEYGGKQWAISKLAIHLLGVSSVNGFCYFSYEGETLWERRLRLERTGDQEENEVEEVPLPAEMQVAEKVIIGSEGRPLSPSTWRLFKSAGTDPRVAEWARRVKKGESVENIANENNLTISTVKQYIINRRRYFNICKKNDIVPEGGTNV